MKFRFWKSKHQVTEEEIQENALRVENGLPLTLPLAILGERLRERLRKRKVYNKQNLIKLEGKK